MVLSVGSPYYVLSVEQWAKSATGAILRKPHLLDRKGTHHSQRTKDALTWYCGMARDLKQKWHGKLSKKDKKRQRKRTRKVAGILQKFAARSTRKIQEHITKSLNVSSCGLFSTLDVNRVKYVFLLDRALQHIYSWLNMIFPRHSANLFRKVG